MKPDNKIKFISYKGIYTVQAANERYAICVDLKHPKRLYTIVDLVENVKGTCDHYSYGAITKEKCEEILVALVDKKVGISMRNRAPLDIEYTDEQNI